MAQTSPGSNGGPTKAAFLAYVDEMISARNVLDTANSTYRNVLKRAKGDGINTKQMLKALADSRLSAAERQAEDSSYMLMREWLGKPVGYQPAFDLGDEGEDGEGATQAAGIATYLETVEDVEATQKHFLAEAYREGVSDGKIGANPASCPYDPGSEYAQQYSLGHTEGKRQATEASPPKPRGRQKRGAIAAVPVTEEQSGDEDSGTRH